MRAAWTAAAAQRAKKMPLLKDLLSVRMPVPKRAGGGWQAMYAVATAWAASDGEIRAEGGRQ